METITGCEHLTDDALLAAAKVYAAKERENAEALLRHLSEIGHRKLHEREGYASVFSFCLTALRLSEAESWRRSVAAESARRYTAIYEMVGRGELNLAVVAAVAPHLNRENYRTLLRRCVGKSRRQVDALVADLEERKETRDRVRRLAAPVAHAAADARAACAEAALPLAEAPALKPVAQRTASQRSAEPSSQTDPRAARRADVNMSTDTQTRSRRVPTAVKAEVYRRDEGRCSYAAPSGRRCAETVRLEFDHRIAFALGGRSDDAAGIRLLCRAHNLRAAREAGLDAKL